MRKQSPVNDSLQIILPSSRPALSEHTFDIAFKNQILALEELRRLRSAASADRLLQELPNLVQLSNKHPEIKRLKLKATILSELSEKACKLEPLSKKATKAEIKVRGIEINSHIKNFLAPLFDRNSSQQNSDIFKALQAHIGDLSISMLFSKNQQLSDQQLINRLNSLLIKIRIFERFGLAVTDHYDFDKRSFRSWSNHAMCAVIGGLEKIPAPAVLWTPCLHVIKRTDPDPKFSREYGLLDTDGRVGVRDLAYRHEILIQRTVIHEIGHAIHFGQNYDLKYDQHGKITSSGDPLYDFPGYAEISGWRVVNKPFELDRHNNVIIIDSKMIPLSKTINENGKITAYSIDRDSPIGMILWSHKADSEFASDLNSFSNPWEDWAEGWEQFIYAPEIFQQLAPKKYAYFAGHFGERVHN